MNSTTKSDLSIGSLRLKVCYTEDHVFPSSYYDPLRETVLEVDGSEVSQRWNGYNKFLFVTRHVG